MPDVEICGLLLGEALRVSDVLPCRNVAPDPRVAFEIDPAQLIAAHRAQRGGGPIIVGCYHSHPRGTARPSARDAAAAAPDGSIWIILAAQEIGFFRAAENGSEAGRFDTLAHCVVAD